MFPNYKCLNSLNLSSSGCLSTCSGLILTSFSNPEESKDLEVLLFAYISRDIADYRNYTKWLNFPLDSKNIKG